MVYVDNINIKFRNMIMNHMIADTVEELHQMADKIGIDRKWVRHNIYFYYNISSNKKKLAIKYGAKEIDSKKRIEEITIEILKKYDTSI